MNHLRDEILFWALERLASRADRRDADFSARRRKNLPLHFGQLPAQLVGLGCYDLTVFGVVDVADYM